VREKTEGLLILYPLDYQDEKADIGVEEPILGFAISFPTVPEFSATHVTYTVNNVYQQQELEFE
jgi:hypothetical protein